MPVRRNERKRLQPIEYLAPPRAIQHNNPAQGKQSAEDRRYAGYFSQERPREERREDGADIQEAGGYRRRKTDKRVAPADIAKDRQSAEIDDRENPALGNAA